MTPCSLIEAASSFRLSSGNTFRGWCGVALIRSISILMPERVSISALVVLNSAPIPLPKAFLDILHNLFRQFLITHRSNAFRIVFINGDAVGRSFAQADIARYNGPEYFFFEILGHFLD